MEKKRSRSHALLAIRQHPGYRNYNSSPSSQTIPSHHALEATKYHTQPAARTPSPTTCFCHIFFNAGTFDATFTRHPASRKCVAIATPQNCRWSFRSFTFATTPRISPMSINRTPTSRSAVPIASLSSGVEPSKARPCSFPCIIAAAPSKSKRIAEPVSKLMAAWARQMRENVRPILRVNQRLFNQIRAFSSGID